MNSPPSKETAIMRDHTDNVTKIVFLAVSTGLVFVVTRLAYVPISAFNGQEFDLGDVMIFTFAWTFGPAIGAFAGGVGSGLSDASLSSPFAPFTLVIKGSEGFLAGYFAKRNSKWSRGISWALASTAMVVGYFFTNWVGLGFGLLAALYEAPFDIAQVVTGGVVGGRVAQYLRKSLPVTLPFHKTSSKS